MLLDGIPLVSVARSSRIYWTYFGMSLFAADCYAVIFTSFNRNLITFNFILGTLLKGDDVPKEEENFQKVYVKAPSFLSIHMGVKAEVLPPDTDCHHFVLEVLCFSFQYHHLLGNFLGR